MWSSKALRANRGSAFLAERHPSTGFHGSHWTLFLAVVVVVIIFVSAPLFCGLQAFAQPLRATQSTAFDQVPATAQSSILGSVSMSVPSESDGLEGLLLSDVSDDTNEDDGAFDPSEVFGILCFFILMLKGQRPLLADHEQSAKPYSVYCSILERPG